MDDRVSPSLALKPILKRPIGSLEAGAFIASVTKEVGWAVIVTSAQTAIEGTSTEMPAIISFFFIYFGLS